MSANLDERVLTEARRAGDHFTAREVHDALGGDVAVQAVTAALGRLRARGLVVYEAAQKAGGRRSGRRRVEAAWWPREAFERSANAAIRWAERKHV